MEKQVVIETRNVRKTFPGVVALDGINVLRLGKCMRLSVRTEPENPR